MPLLLDALFATVTAGIFAYVGRDFARRPASEDTRRARDCFVAWWYGLSVVTLVGALRSALGAAGFLDLSVHVALSFFSLLPLMVALFGLLYYLLFIHTGNARLFTPLAVAYTALFVGFAWLITWLKPTAVKVDAWSVGFEYARKLEGWPVGVLIILLLGPVLVAALLYGSLVFRAKTRIARYRVGMTSGAFLLWFGSSGIASVLGLTTLPNWPVASRAIGLVSTLMVLAAYRPPAALRRRLESEPEGVETERPRRPDRLAPALSYASASMRSRMRGVRRMGPALVA